MVGLAGLLLLWVTPVVISGTAKAPDFKLSDFNGNPVQLSALKGKIVVLEWTNYDCPFVKAHYNEKTHTMRDLAAKYADKGVVWLTINSTHYATVEANKKWAAENELKQAVLLDKDGAVGKLYNAKTTPHMFIVDKEGNLAYQGAIDNAPRGQKPDSEAYINYVDQALAELTAGEPVVVKQARPYGCSVKYAKRENAK